MARLGFGPWFHYITVTTRSRVVKNHWEIFMVCLDKWEGEGSRGKKDGRVQFIVFGCSSV